MTLIFIPKTIETVEEAEALPDGTMARKDDFDGWIDLAVKGSRGWARVDSSPTDRRQDDAMIGWTALIPVEADIIHSTPMGTRHLLEYRSRVPVAGYIIDSIEEEA